MDARYTATVRHEAASAAAPPPAGDDAAGPSVTAGPKTPRERKIFPPEFPEGLKPRLRLFLSVDLVGSTPYKQTRHMWRPEIVSFYRNFDYILQRQYREFSSGLGDGLLAPEFWKSNGDELLYVCELQSLSHAHAMMHVWLATLDEYRGARDEASKHLDVKSTAWIGLFPVPNAEIFFRRGTAWSDVNDPVLGQAEIREEFYANPANPTITREFVGPSIDTGFRLTSWASPNRLIVSVDLAFLLTGAYTRKVGPLRLHLSGKDKLKGVIDNQPYPTLWIPVGRSRLDPVDRRLGEVSTDRSTIRSYCEAIIEQNYKSITPLYLAGAHHEDYDWAPPYILTAILRHWDEEKRHREEVNGVVLIDD